MKVHEKRQVVAWVERARGGEERALEELIRFYSRRLGVWFGRHVLDSWLREDLLQETLLNGLLGLATVRDPWRFDAWICRIARRTAINAFRRRHPQVCDPRTLVHLEELGRCRLHPVAEPPAGPWDGEELLAVLAALPGTGAALVAEHHGAGIPITELARREGMTLSGMKMRLHRARRRLRPLLARTLARTPAGRALLDYLPSAPGCVGPAGSGAAVSQKEDGHEEG